MKKVSALIFVFLLSISCKKILFKDVPDKTPASIFEQTWNFTNEKYSFFEYKNINWDSIHTVFSAKIYPSMAEDSLFNVLADMLYLLKDGHVNLISPFNISRNWEWYLDYPTNYSEEILDRYYFNDKQTYVGPFKVFDFNDVGYFHYASFSSEVTEKDMKIVLDKFRNHKGLIIDLRDNGGGSISNVYTIGGHFVNKATVCAKEKTKTGPGKNDFSSFNSLGFYPIEKNVAYQLPVVLLTNRKCYSATNYFVTMMSELSNVTVIGDKTGGGGGVPTFTQLSNAWTIRVSGTQTYTLQGVNNENGVEPDVKIDITETDISNHYDAILETALTFLRQ